MTTRAWVVAVCVLGACNPTLEEGHYGCPSGHCPSGWSCHSDGLCYSTPDVDGSRPLDLGSDLGDAAVVTDLGDAGAPPDARVEMDAGGSLYAPCSSDVECGSLSCPEIDDAIGVPRQCSHACTSPLDCAPAATSGAVYCTPAGNCAASCAVGLCPATSASCFRAHVDAVVAAVCADDPRTIVDAGYLASCTTDTECTFPFSCVHRGSGFCGLRCDPPTFDCPMGDVCVALGTASYCLQSCTNPSRCPSDTHSCTALESGGTKYCLSSGF